MEHSLEIEKRLTKLEHEMTTLKDNLEKQEQLIKDLTKAIESLNRTLVMGSGMVKLISIAGAVVLFFLGIYKVFK